MKTSSTSSTFRNFIASISLFGFAVFHYGLLLEKFGHMTIYQGRDIQRAIELLKGQWIWHGPDLSGGGYTPGPFYYYLLSLPLSLFGTWQSVMWLSIIMSAAAAVVFWHFLKTRFDSLTALIFYFLFLTSAVFDICLIQFWNPSYLPLFQAVLVCLFFDYKRVSPKTLAFGSFLLGLTIQIHYQQSLFLVGLLVAICSDRSKEKRERLISALVVVSFVLLPCLPFLILGPKDADVYNSFGSGVYSLGQTFSSLLDFNAIRIGIYGIFERFLLKETTFLVLSLAYIVSLGKDRAIIQNFLSENLFLKSTLFASAIMFLPNIYSPIYLRYLMPFFLIFFLLSSIHISKICKKYPIQYVWGILFFSLLFLLSYYFLRGLFISFVTLGLVPLTITFSLLAFGRKNAKVASLLMFPLFVAAHSKLVTDPPRKLDYRQAFAATLVQETGWAWEYFRERAYVVGKIHEQDIATMYKQAYRQFGMNIKKRDYDGVLINYKWYRWDESFFENKQSVTMDLEKFKSALPPEIIRMVEDETIVCHSTFRQGSYEFCFYKFSSPDIDFTLNNFGYPYEFSEPLNVTIEKEFSSAKTGDRTWNFYWSRCESREPSCVVYFTIKSLKDGRAEVMVKGDPVSTPEGVANPSWTVSIENLALKMTCGGKESTQEISSLLGYLVRHSKFYRPIFLGPFKIHIPFDCENPSKLVVESPKTISEVMTKTFPPEPLKIVWSDSEGSF